MNSPVIVLACVSQLLILCCCLPIVDPGLFVIMGVKSCRAGSGYCLLGLDCTLDEDFLPDDEGGHCDGLRSAFTPSAHFICCRYNSANKTDFIPMITTPDTQDNELDYSSQSMQEIEPMPNEEFFIQEAGMFNEAMETTTKVEQDALLLAKEETESTSIKSVFTTIMPDFNVTEEVFTGEADLRTVGVDDMETTTVTGEEYVTTEVASVTTETDSTEEDMTTQSYQNEINTLNGNDSDQNTKIRPLQARVDSEATNYIILTDKGILQTLPAVVDANSELVVHENNQDTRLRNVEVGNAEITKEEIDTIDKIEEPIIDKKKTTNTVNMATKSVSRRETQEERINDVKSFLPTETLVNEITDNPFQNSEETSNLNLKLKSEEFPIKSDEKQVPLHAIKNKQITENKAGELDNISPQILGDTSESTININHAGEATTNIYSTPENNLSTLLQINESEINLVTVMENSDKIIDFTVSVTDNAGLATENKNDFVSSSPSESRSEADIKINTSEDETNRRESPNSSTSTPEESFIFTKTENITTMTVNEDITKQQNSNDSHTIPVTADNFTTKQGLTNEDISNNAETTTLNIDEIYLEGNLRNEDEFPLNSDLTPTDVTQTTTISYNTPSDVDEKEIVMKSSLEMKELETSTVNFEENDNELATEINPKTVNNARTVTEMNMENISITELSTNIDKNFAEMFTDISTGAINTSDTSTDLIYENNVETGTEINTRLLNDAQITTAVSSTTVKDIKATADINSTSLSSVEITTELITDVMNNTEINTKSINNIEITTSVNDLGIITDINTRFVSDEETAADTNTEVISDIQTVTNSSTDVISDEQTSTDTNTEVISDLQTATHINTRLVSDEQTATDTNTEIISEVETATDSNTEVISDVQTATTRLVSDEQTAADTNTEIISEVETATDSNTEVISEVETATDSNTEVMNDVQRTSEQQTSTEQIWTAFNFHTEHTLKPEATSNYPEPERVKPESNTISSSSVEVPDVKVRSEVLSNEITSEDSSCDSRSSSKSRCWVVEFMKDNSTMCVGSYMDRSTIVTSANCVSRIFGYGLTRVVLRSAGGAVILPDNILDIVVHEEFRNRNVKVTLNDIGLVHLKPESQMPPAACVLCLPKSEQELLDRSCETEMRGKSADQGMQIGSAMVCRGRVLAGVMSYLDPDPVYTPINDYISWIRTNQKVQGSLDDGWK